MNLGRKLALFESQAALKTVNAIQDFRSPLNLSHEEYVEHINGLYNSAYDEVGLAMKNLPLSKEEIDHAQKFLLTLIRLAECGAYWITERKLWTAKHKGPLSDDLIDRIEPAKRQIILVDNLRTFPREFTDFSNLRKNTLDYLHDAKEEPRFLTDRNYNYFTTGF